MLTMIAKLSGNLVKDFTHVFVLRDFLDEGCKIACNLKIITPILITIAPITEESGQDREVWKTLIP